MFNLLNLQSGQSITLEPGGQFELSGAPLSTLHQTCGEVNSHLYQVRPLKCPGSAVLISATNKCHIFIEHPKEVGRRVRQ